MRKLPNPSVALFTEGPFSIQIILGSFAQNAKSNTTSSPSFWSLLSLFLRSRKAFSSSVKLRRLDVTDAYFRSSDFWSSLCLPAIWNWFAGENSPNCCSHYGLYFRVTFRNETPIGMYFWFIVVFICYRLKRPDMDSRKDITNFGYCPWCTVSIVLYFHKHNSLPLGQIRAFTSFY